jgi:hypothetical protein
MFATMTDKVRECHLQDEIERLRAENAKLVDENNRLQEWKDAAIAQAEDRDEFVLAQINRDLKREIERLIDVAAGIRV